ncbi:MAG: glucose 1-dehydrogenase [Deltaproteobacteria bacterium]|jgi:3alpha(or 20beta)-hydroxysteroid dehydrogenase|nr:glucose 1-dehydrogenase [Deltaproteobacteria bacterium]MBW2496065.1 glucose 1-dehydrogenase [Deltaproteobacteria bacterium]
MSGRLEGKVALVSGSAQGMGAATARRFVAEGARVVVSDLEDELGEKLASALGEQALYVHLDVTRESDWQAAVEQTLSTFGRLDVLVNNAGIGEVGRLDTLPIEDHRRILDVNLNGVYLGMRTCAKALAAEGGGAIVNISSIDGLAGVTHLTSYSASKFGVRGLTRSAALELGHRGIRVNSVHPGFIETPLLTNNLRDSSEAREMIDGLMSRQPIPRLGRPEEIASLVLFLASDESSYCTGAEFVIDGGHLAGPYRDPVGLYANEE